MSRTCELHLPLVGLVALSVHRHVRRHHAALVVGHDDAGQAADEARHAVQVADAAGVVQGERGLEPGLDELEADDGDQAGYRAHQADGGGREGEVGDGADGHSAGQSGVLGRKGGDG